jgi:hypothetical protein
MFILSITAICCYIAESNPIYLARPLSDDSYRSFRALYVLHIITLEFTPKLNLHEPRAAQIIFRADLHVTAGSRSHCEMHMQSSWLEIYNQYAQDFKREH